MHKNNFSWTLTPLFFFIYLTNLRMNIKKRTENKNLHGKRINDMINIACNIYNWIFGFIKAQYTIYRSPLPMQSYVSAVRPFSVLSDVRQFFQAMSEFLSFRPVLTVHSSITVDCMS